MRRLTPAATALIALLSPAFADDGYGKFAWPLAREQALFAAADKVSVNAGAVLAAIPKTAFVVHLQPGLEKPGIYQVTLSEEAWIDVVQDDRYARSVGSTGRGDCPGLTQKRAA